MRSCGASGQLLRSSGQAWRLFGSVTGPGVPVAWLRGRAVPCTCTADDLRDLLLPTTEQKSGSGQMPRPVSTSRTPRSHEGGRSDNGPAPDFSSSASRPRYQAGWIAGCVLPFGRAPASGKRHVRHCKLRPHHTAQRGPRAPARPTVRRTVTTLRRWPLESAVHPRTTPLRLRPARDPPAGLARLDARARARLGRGGVERLPAPTGKESANARLKGRA